MSKHKHFDEIIAWANGETVQSSGDRIHWVDMPEHEDFTWCENMFYRVKPKTITVNGVECPAPAQVTGFAGWLEITSFASKTRYYFESFEAAKQVHEALIKPFKESCNEHTT